MAEEPTDGPRLVVMIDNKRGVGNGGSELVADGADAALRSRQCLVLLHADAILATQVLLSPDLRRVIVGRLRPFARPAPVVLKPCPRRELFEPLGFQARPANLHAIQALHVTPRLPVTMLCDPPFAPPLVLSPPPRPTPP